MRNDAYMKMVSIHIGYILANLEMLYKKGINYMM